MKKLGIRNVSRQTVVNIMKENGLDPGPTRGKGTWDEFIKIHASTMWACDFLSKRVWTLRGPIDLYLLVFLQIGSRKVWITGATAHPDSAWVALQARNFCMELPDGDRQRAIVLHDNDTKFTAQFREILKAEGLRPHRLVPVSPNLNAYVERFIQTIQEECLDHFVVVGQAHFDYIVEEFALLRDPEEALDVKFPPRAEHSRGNILESVELKTHFNCNTYVFPCSDHPILPGADGN